MKSPVCRTHTLSLRHTQCTLRQTRTRLPPIGRDARFEALSHALKPPKQISEPNENHALNGASFPVNVHQTPFHTGLLPRQQSPATWPAISSAPHHPNRIYLTLGRSPNLATLTCKGAHTRAHGRTGTRARSRVSSRLWRPTGAFEFRPHSIPVPQACRVQTPQHPGAPDMQSSDLTASLCPRHAEFRPHSIPVPQACRVQTPHYSFRSSEDPDSSITCH